MIRCRLPDWRGRWMLRRNELPDIPEVRRVLRAWSRKGWTFGAAPSAQKLRTLHKEALAAIIRALPERASLFVGCSKHRRADQARHRHSARRGSISDAALFVWIHSRSQHDLTLPLLCLTSRVVSQEFKLTLYRPFTRTR